jgi:hypothetical protein
MAVRDCKGHDASHSALWARKLHPAVLVTRGRARPAPQPSLQAPAWRLHAQRSLARSVLVGMRTLNIQTPFPPHLLSGAHQGRYPLSTHQAPQACLPHAGKGWVKKRRGAPTARGAFSATLLKFFTHWLDCMRFRSNIDTPSARAYIFSARVNLSECLLHHSATA